MRFLFAFGFMVLAGCPISIPKPDANCEDGERNGDESDTDCGGSCGVCAVGAACVESADCDQGVCSEVGECLAAACDDTVFNGQESDLDCGGDCAACADGLQCTEPSDCDSGVCTDDTCASATCADEVKNGSETSLDCGGSCAPCADGGGCDSPTDCVSGVCANDVCQAATCDDGVRNADESDVDCGGICERCDDLMVCFGHGDCESKVCAFGVSLDSGLDSGWVGQAHTGDTGVVSVGVGVCAPPSCFDSRRNADEPEVDCGGGCVGCPDASSCLVPSDCESKVCEGDVCQVADCVDLTLNGGESGVDCGGSCDACQDGYTCHTRFDCESSVCDGGVCATPSCEDDTMNGDESDIDCGGSCGICLTGEMCNDHSECEEGVCDNGDCAVAACNDETVNGNETDVDCGGSCTACALEAGCLDHTDCQSGACFSDECVDATCDDGVGNDDETDVDCGGSCDVCTTGDICGVSEDCDSGVCNGVCQAPECGDDVINGDDICDDDNADETDECLSSCEPGPCHSDYRQVGLLLNEVLVLASTADANCDGVFVGSDEVFVELVNAGVEDVFLDGYTLSDNSGVLHTFGNSDVLASGQGILIFGGGTPTFDGTSLAVAGWCNELNDIATDVFDTSPIWVGGETVTLEDDFGNLIDSLTGSETSDRAVSRFGDRAMGATVGGTPSPGQTTGNGSISPLPLVITEVLADVPTTYPEGDANCDGVRDSGKDEFVEIVNYGSFPVQMGGMTLEDDDQQRHVFGDDVVLMPGHAVVVFGGGNPTFDGSSDTTEVWCKNLPDVVFEKASTGALSVTNAGDSITLRAADVSFIDQVAFGAVSDQSVARLPELAWFGEAEPSIGLTPGARRDGTAWGRRVVINEVYYDATADSNCDATLDAVDDQFVEIVNSGEVDVDLSGGSILVNAAVAHSFNAGTTLDAGEVLVVFGDGTPTFDGSGAGAWCSSHASGVLSQVSSESDLALAVGVDVSVVDADGLVLDVFTIETTAGESNVRQSERYDASVVAHSTVGAQNLSPGWDADLNLLFEGGGGKVDDPFEQCQ
jgi:hypothetical protein